MVTVEKVEIGFDATSANATFTLDDAVKGLLDSSYVLGDIVWSDVTQYATNINVSRGKSRELDRFQAGSLTVSFNNKGRVFDPTYASSPYYGQIVPRKSVRYSADGVMQFVGVIDDWDLSYSVDGNSVASLTAYDGFTRFTNQVLTAQTYPSELSGSRINRILSDANVAWSADSRAIDAGSTTLQGDTVASGVDALSYINTVESTEFGLFFVDRLGRASFKQRNRVSTSATPPVFADNGSGIGFNDVQVVYGSELLFNQGIFTRANSTTVATANDYVSQNTYGIRNTTVDGLLLNNDTDLANYASFYINFYSQPEYRFEFLSFPLHDMSDTNKQVLLNLDIGDVCQIVFTPNNVPPAISVYAQIIGVTHSSSILGEHIMGLRFQNYTQGGFTLDDAVFGLLDLNKLGY